MKSMHVKHYTVISENFDLEKFLYNSKIKSMKFFRNI